MSQTVNNMPHPPRCVMMRFTDQKLFNVKESLNVFRGNYDKIVEISELHGLNVPKDDAVDLQKFADEYYQHCLQYHCIHLKKDDDHLYVGDHVNDFHIHINNQTSSWNDTTASKKLAELRIYEITKINLQKYKDGENFKCGTEYMVYLVPLKEYIDVFNIQDCLLKYTPSCFLQYLLENPINETTVNNAIDNKLNFMNFDLPFRNGQFIYPSYGDKYYFYRLLFHIYNDLKYIDVNMTNNDVTVLKHRSDV